jgi:hypothetical protein
MTFELFSESRLEEEILKFEFSGSSSSILNLFRNLLMPAQKLVEFG